MATVRVIRETEHFNSDEIALQNLRAAVRGAVILREDSAFEQASGVFRDTIKGYPFMIVRCREEADVMVALEFAREHKMVVGVYGSSSLLTAGACDDGIVIDVSRLKGGDVNLKDKLRRDGNLPVFGKPMAVNIH